MADNFGGQYVKVTTLDGDIVSLLRLMADGIESGKIGVVTKIIIHDHYDMGGYEATVVEQDEYYLNRYLKETGMANITEFVKLAEKADRIARDEQLTWEEKYDLVFSDDISDKIQETGLEADWLDPDASYEEDVMSYVKAQHEKARRFQGIS